MVSFHLPLTDDTRHMLNRDSLAWAKPGVIVINTCRGGLIEEAALIEALRSGQVSGAGLDVFEDEPLGIDHPLLAFDNVIVTPHAAWFSPEAVRDLPVHAAANLIDFLDGREVLPIVNPGFVAVQR